MVKLDPQNAVSFFRFSLVMIAIINFICSYSVEVSHTFSFAPNFLYSSIFKLQKIKLLVDQEWYKHFGRIVMRKKEPKNKYKRIKLELEGDKSWPPRDKITFSQVHLSNENLFIN